MTLSEILKQTQTELLGKLKTLLIEKGYEMFVTDRYLFAKGTIPVMLIAHLDTVHKTPPKELFYDKKKDVLWSPDGIGGDDRCGVYAILTIIEKGYRPYILFTTDEEKGCLGAKDFTEEYLFDLKKELKYMVEIDRRGDKQAVFYSCGNKEFQEYILSFGFTEFYGSCSDISTLSPKYDIASVNLSAGYYNEHTLQEYIKLGHLLHTVKLLETLILDIENSKFYDYQKKTYVYNYSDYNTGSKKDDKKDDKKKDTVASKYEQDIDDSLYWQMYADWYNLSAEEWKKTYNFEKPPTAEEVWDW